jgi:hypothetical protein
MVTLVGMVVAALAAYYILVEFIYPLKSPDIMPVESFSGISQARGLVVAIKRDSQSVSTTTVVTIAIDSGEERQVRIPLNPSLDCVAPNIADPASLIVGDTIDVKGADVGDEIFPCQEPGHHMVRVMMAVPAVTEEIVVASSTASTTSVSTDTPVTP